MVGEKYVTALIDAADALPLLIPVLADRLDIEELLETVDGIMLTGSPSDIEPHHYTDEAGHPEATRDAHRDSLNLPLARRAVEIGVPMFAICRGFQELNVSLGGTLHQKLSLVDGMLAHQENPADPVEVQYGPAHDVALVPGGLLEELTGVDRLTVNSLHGQGVDRLAPALVAEAHADDGLVEAYRVANAPGFALAVQWHPEWRATDNAASVAIFSAFGAACRERHRARRTTWFAPGGTDKVIGE